MYYKASYDPADLGFLDSYAEFNTDESVDITLVVKDSHHES